MLKIDKNKKKLNQLEKITLTESGITERYDLQAMIKNSPDVFFNEMGESLLLIGEEVRPTDVVEDRIDLLALDRDGNTVIIELKRGNDKFQLLQSLSYAAMTSDWQPERIVEQFNIFSGNDDAENQIENFLLEGLESLNSTQRIILIAEQYNYEVLVTAEWLTDFYAIDIKCYRLNISKENDENEYISCTCIFPPPEIAEHVIKRGRQKSLESNYPNSWDEVFANTTNKAVVNFFKKEIEDGRENYVKHKDLYFRVNGKREFFLGARKERSYVWQYHRFEGDVNFWNETIGGRIEVQEVGGAKSLRFFLYTEDDFDIFKKVVETELLDTNFI